MRRLLATLLATLLVSVVCGSRLAAADPANPFAVGDFDFLNTCGPTPILSLSISNHGSVPSSQYTIFRDVTLFVAYKKPDGTFYPPASAPVPSIAAGSEQTINVPVLAADTTYTIAVKATSVATRQIIALLKGTVITPSRTICAPAAPSKPVVVLPKGGAPAPAPAPCVGSKCTAYISLNTAQLRTNSKTVANNGGNLASGYCSNDCLFANHWAGPSLIGVNTASSLEFVGAYDRALVGYVHDNQTHSLQHDGRFSEYFRSAFTFNLWNIPRGKRVRSATLELHGQRTMYDYQPSSNVMCGTQLAAAQDHWWTDAHDPLDKANFSKPVSVTSASSNTVVVDVTAIVRGWVNDPESNDGFVLRGSDENTDVFVQSSCVTQYNFIQLHVLYDAS